MKKTLNWHDMMLMAAIITGLVGVPQAALADAGRLTETTRCQPARPHLPGLTEYRIASGDRMRRYEVYVPQSYSGEVPAPLVFDLQASGISPQTELQITGLDRVAEEKGFIVVLPAAVTEFPRGGHTWNVPQRGAGADDVAFIGEVLEAVSAALCVDSMRIYATGFSGGARLASELACRMPERFAAISAVGGLRHPSGAEGECATAGRAVPVLAFHSVDDPVNPYQHASDRSPPYWSYGIEEALQRWTRHNRCAGPGSEQHVAERVVRITHGPCQGGGILEFYRLSGSGHTWPGSDFVFPDYLGSAEQAVDATALSVEFFERFRLVPGE